jgi:outer membrane protein TolC
VKDGLVWLVALLALGTTSTTAAQSDYRDLRTAFEQYQPPAHLFRSAPETLPAPPAGADAFEAEKQHLVELKARWLKEIRNLSAPTAFYQPDAQVLAALETAGTDTAAAQAAVSREFSQETPEVMALLRSPAIKAADNRVRAAVEKYGQVSAVDDILRRYTAFTEGGMTGVGAMRGHGGGQGQFPFPAVLALKGRIVTQDVLAAREQLEAARRDAVTAARTRHWRLWSLHQTVSITERTIGLLRELEQVSITRYEAGKTSFQDVIKVRLQRELLDERLVTLREQLRTTHMEMREVLHLPPDTPIGVPQVHLAEADLPDLASLYGMTLLHRQELRGQRARLGKMDALLEMAETMLLPAFDMGLSQYRDRAIRQVGTQARQSTFATGITASAGAGQPKRPWFGFGDSYLREMRQKRLAMQEELQRMQDAALAAVRRKWFALDRAGREKRLYQDTVVQLSEAALEVSTSGYESDRVAFADVISSYTLWLDTNLALAEKRSAYGTSLAELEQAVGRSFTQPGEE